MDRQKLGNAQLAELCMHAGRMSQEHDELLLAAGREHDLPKLIAAMRRIMAEEAEFCAWVRGMEGGLWMH